MNKNRTARCLCEKSAITVVGEPELVAVCNCLSCQRQFGSAFGWVAYFKESSVISKQANSGHTLLKGNSYDALIQYRNC